jgi:type VI secretion system secreted protein VgrG
MSPAAERSLPRLHDQYCGREPGPRRAESSLECDLPHIGLGLFRLNCLARHRTGTVVFCLRLKASVAHQGCGDMADATLTEDRPRQSGGTSTREDRLLSIDTPLGKDKLVLTEFVGEEEISQPFLFTATMRSEDPDIKPERLIGSKVTIWIKRETTEPVPISGMVRSLSSASVDVRGFREYQAEIVPWLWLLNCTTDCRIFQNQTFPKIIETIFGDYGFTDYETSGLTGSYQKLDFCVQYRESAFAFISRWMEELGIFYFFRHEANRHVMVLADQNRAFKPVVEKEALFGDHSGSNISQWRHSYQFRSGRYAHKDFAFKTPSQDLSTKESSLLKLQRGSAFELYDYPGGYTQKGDGQQLTRVRMEEHEAAYHTVAGASICASFFAGGKFTMSRHHLQAEEKQEYVLRRVVHRASDYTYITANMGPPSYDNTFEAFPAATKFRSASRTPWPAVQGPQTATVVGPGDIHTDKHGRVKLQFHWDRRGKKDDKSSCWVRVSQNWAGKGWGGVFIPHVGQEVVVSFLEGDPDMPLVTGRVYNGENSKAISLPANKTQSAIQDHSGNKLQMEGKGGSEEIHLHAVKDMKHTVVNDRTKTVGNDETTKVGGHRKENVDKTESVKIKLTRTHDVGLVDTLNVGAARFHTVGAAETISVGAARMVSVGAYQRTQIGVSHSVDIGTTQTIDIGTSQTIDVGTDHTMTVGANHTVSIGAGESRSVAKDRSTQIDENDTLNVKKSISNTAGEGMTFSAKKDVIHKNDKGSITIHENGDITIKGGKITIEGSGDVVVDGKKITQTGKPIHLN